ncbi:hypothetical protein F5B21DRAFT_529255 [Xylaria acuta]|nr:hypothetical protein F5B21DRAFT_529255 [Xylaria acuta]
MAAYSITIMPVRHVCVRCHAHKLACPSRTDKKSPSCARYVRANAVRVVGTSVRSMRPSAVAAAGLRTATKIDGDVVAAAASTTSSKRLRRDNNDEAAASISPSVLTPISLIGGADVTIMSTAFDHPNSEAQAQDFLVPEVFQNPASESTNPNAHIQAVAKLTKLNVDLLRHASTIPYHYTMLQDPPNYPKPFNLNDTTKPTKAMLDVVRPPKLPGSLGANSTDAVTINTASVSSSCLACTVV